MTKKRISLESLITEDESLAEAEIDRRTAIAKMHQLELAVNKEYIAFQEKLQNICRIDSALSSFDEFLTDFVEMLISLPDHIQSIIPECKPDQYRAVQSFIDDQIQRLSQKRLYLAIESTAEAKALATEAKVESQKNATKVKRSKK